MHISTGKGVKDLVTDSRIDKIFDNIRPLMK